MGILRGKMSSNALPPLKKKDINKVNEFGSTPIQAAVHSNDVSRVNNVLELNGDPNLTEKPTGETALHRAVLNRNLDIVSILLEAKADVNAPGRYGTALHLAANRNEDLVKVLLKGKADLNFTNRDGNLPLTIAALNCKAKNVRRLIKAKADLNAKNSKGNSLLHVAAEKHKWHVVEFLLNQGIDPNIRNENGATILHEVRETAVVEQLLSKKADPNIQDHQGSTPLHRSMGSSWPITKALLDGGADTNICNNSNHDALLEAASSSVSRLTELVGYLEIDLLSKEGEALVEKFQKHSIPERAKQWIKDEQEKQKQNKEKT